MMLKTFWMNYAEGNSSPTFQFDDKEKAFEEAKRLAKLLKVKVYTLQAVKSVALVEYIENEYCENPDLPF